MRQLHILSTLSLLLLFLPLGATASDCTNNKICIKNEGGCMQLEVTNDIGCIQQYYLYQDHIVGIAYSKGYFIYNRETEESLQFHDSRNWVNELKERNLGPLPTTNYGEASALMNRKSMLQKLDYDRATDCFMVDGYIVGEGERYRFFIFDEKTRRSEQFLSRKEWNEAIGEQELTPLVTRWHQGSWNFSLINDGINLALDHVKITIGLLIGLVLAHLLVILKVLGSRSQRFKLSILCFMTFEMAGLAYLLMANLPYSF